jgi:biopolymer transport protein TolR
MKEIKAAVAEMIREGKVAATSDSKVIIAAEAETQYEAIVGTMDATRETPDRKLLFPDVTLASF